MQEGAQRKLRHNPGKFSSVILFFIRLPWMEQLILGHINRSLS